MGADQRIDYARVFPAARQAMVGLQRAVDAAELEPLMLELVKVRASQINGCAYCLDMHSKDLRVAGETEQRLYLLDAWREAPFYTERERAALAWTEALTRVSADHVPDGGLRVRCVRLRIGVVDESARVVADQFDQRRDP